MVPGDPFQGSTFYLQISRYANGNLPPFTPRNVQTASERAKLVYRVKVSVDNAKGTLKPGMHVEVEFGPAR